MSTLLDLVQSLRRIETWLAHHHPDRLPLWRPGAEAHTIQRLEARLGKPMPADIRLLYGAHDGQPEGAPSLYLNQRWLPLDLVAVAWEDLNLRHGTDGVLTPPDTYGQTPVLQAAAWSPGWLPLFGSPRGDHYCVDLRHDRPDRYGQVIWFLYDRPERPVVAPSLAHMLLRVADGLERGAWRLDPGYDGLSD